MVYFFLNLVGLFENGDIFVCNKILDENIYLYYLV